MSHVRGSAISVALIKAVEEAAKGRKFSAAELAEITEGVWSGSPYMADLQEAVDDIRGWVEQGYTGLNECPLDGYGREVLREALAWIDGERPEEEDAP